MEIPYQDIAPQTLRHFIEYFVTSEGTDYGHEELSLEAKVEMVLEQLRQKKAVISFDPKSESFYIVEAKSGQS